jgi:drug/metabolite transporter (DMT)-like permease
MVEATRARWQIHFCVMLWGFTPLLGKAISLSAPSLVWWRMTLVSLALLAVPGVWRHVAALPIRLTAAYAGTGVLVAVHWVTFYGAIKLANASVAASALALCPVFLAVIEPWIARSAHRPSELWLGLAVVPGVLLVIGGTPDTMNAGIALGVFSAFVVAIFGACNKRLIQHGDALTITWIEMAAGAVALTITAPLLSADPVFVMPGARDSLLLGILAFACTLLPFALSLVALRHLSAFSVQLAVNLEPVYAIVLAMLLFAEQRELSPWFYVGAAIILAVVFVQPLLVKPLRRPVPA